jgi:putative phosphoesterase
VADAVEVVGEVIENVLPPLLERMVVAVGALQTHSQEHLAHQRRDFVRLAAVETMGSIDAQLCLGDSIYEYGFSNAVIGRLRELDALTILGNHEEVFLGAAGVRARSRADIDRPLLGWLAEQPHRRELMIDGKRILMVHSTPWEPRGSYVLPTSSELQRFGEADADIVLYGHTHQQVVRRVGRVLVVNPGSAGEARDPRNGRQLSCALLDTVTEEVVVRDFPALPVGRHPERG